MHAYHAQTRFSQRSQFVSLADILSDEGTTLDKHVNEAIPQSFINAIAALESSDSLPTQQSYRLLKLLTVLRDGETFESIRRFYHKNPFHSDQIEELVAQNLVEAVPIFQTAADLAISVGPRSATSNPSPKLLRVPRQVRDYVSANIPNDERASIIEASTELFFGKRWRQGDIRLRTTLRNAYGHSAMTGPGNEHLIARHLLGKALEKGERRQIVRTARLALGYCHRLVREDRFRDALIASDSIVFLLRGTSYQEFFVDARQMNGKALRMLGKHLDAIEVLKDAIEKGQKFLIDDAKADILLALALAYQDLDRPAEAKKAATDVIELVHHEDGAAFQAQGILAECDLSGQARHDRLIHLEQEARNRGRLVAANNIAIVLAQDGKDADENLKRLDQVIRTAKDNYSRTRAVINKATLLGRLKRVNELSPEDHFALNAAYSYSYAQRIGNLLDSCHRVLWGLFKKDGLFAPLFRLFRFSSFIWRFLGKDKNEAEYLLELKEIPLDEARSRSGQSLHMEIHYIQCRIRDRS